jgi:hypothetical protein
LLNGALGCQPERSREMTTGDGTLAGVAVRLDSGGRKERSLATATNWNGVHLAHSKRETEPEWR